MIDSRLALAESIANTLEIDMTNDFMKKIDAILIRLFLFGYIMKAFEEDVES